MGKHILGVGFARTGTVEGSFIPLGDATLVPVALLGAVAFSIAMGFVDVSPIPMSVYLALQLPIALAAVLTARAVIADALLHEDRVDGEEQRTCPECDHPIAEGASGRDSVPIAVWRSMRRQQRRGVVTAALSSPCSPVSVPR